MAINFALYHNWLCILLRSQGKCNFDCIWKGSHNKKYRFCKSLHDEHKKKNSFDTVRLKSKEETAKKTNQRKIVNHNFN